jgi:hypothetical protein
MSASQAAIFTSPATFAVRRISSNAFGLGVSALAEAVQFVNERLELEAA